MVFKTYHASRFYAIDLPQGRCANLLSTFMQPEKYWKVLQQSAITTVNSEELNFTKWHCQSDATNFLFVNWSICNELVPWIFCHSIKKCFSQNYGGESLEKPGIYGRASAQLRRRRNYRRSFAVYVVSCLPVKRGENTSNYNYCNFCPSIFLFFFPFFFFIGQSRRVLVVVHLRRMPSWWNAFTCSVLNG